MKFDLKINVSSWRSGPTYIGDGLKVCSSELRKHFSIPRGQQNIRLVVTKTKHPEAYELSKKRVRYEACSLFEHTPRMCSRTDYQLDGRRVQLYPQANGAMTRALKAGYKYVRCTYE